MPSMLSHTFQPKILGARHENAGVVRINGDRRLDLLTIWSSLSNDRYIDTNSAFWTPVESLNSSRRLIGSVRVDRGRL